jgi:hypothetical protein
VYGVQASRELVSNITDVVTDEIEIWRNRPVDLDLSRVWQGWPPVDGAKILIMGSVR